MIAYFYLIFIFVHCALNVYLFIWAQKHKYNTYNIYCIHTYPYPTYLKINRIPVSHIHAVPVTHICVHASLYAENQSWDMWHAKRMLLSSI